MENFYKLSFIFKKILGKENICIHLFALKNYMSFIRRQLCIIFLFLSCI